MNKIFVLIGLVVIAFITPLAFSQGLEQLAINTSSGELDAISTADDSVIFNGKRYTYALNEKISTLAIDESEPQALNIKDLKVGELYYFDSVSNVKNPSNSDFKKIVFITDTKPMVME